MSMRNCVALALIGLLAAVPTVFAQSQAINGTIEGVVRDSTGGLLPGVTITVTNPDTGATRVLTSDSEGNYRALLLPLGTYRVRAELDGFKVTERTSISISAGQTALVNMTMEVGGIEEVIQVTAEAPVTEPGKIDLGRTINETEVKNLPLVARNPFNFALIQPNVTGYENEEFGATRMNANGTQMRTNYQIDGSSATQKDRAGLRMFQPSEVMIKEVKVITSGFAPEFGQTTGMVFNTITPSGTNQLHGEASYRLRRKGLSSRPLLLAETAPKPDTKIDGITGALGGPIVKDKWHFYVGYEWRRNDLSNDRVITVTPETASTLGLSSEALGDGVIPAIQTVNMFIAKVDGQLNPDHRLSARWALFKNSTPENSGGGLNTREIAPDFEDRMDSASLQLVSSFTPSTLNELRIGYGKRVNPRTVSEVAANSGLPFQVQISGVANFGKPTDAPTDFVEKYWQVVDNFSFFKGRHNIKLGFDLQFITDERLSSTIATYVFPSTAAYLAARDGINPFGYTRFSQNVGDPTVDYSQQYYSFFIQDDFRITPSFKLLFGVRYDLFSPPDGEPDAPAAETRAFKKDKNNFAPRVGFSWSLDDEARTVLRASTGIMYEPPMGQIYQDALLEAGLPRLLTASLSPTSAGAPAYPGTLENLPPGVVPSRTIRVVNPDYDNQYAFMSNVQIERALTDELSFAVGFVNSTGRSLPVSLNSNYLASGATLGDGRPILDPNNRVRDEFAGVLEVRSTGKSAYNAFTLNLNKRMSHGFQANASYTWSKAKDHGLAGRYVVGSIDREGLSNPLDQELDYGLTAWDTRNTFILNTVIEPESENAILRNNRLSVIVMANSGLPFNIRSNRDLNADGFTNDRPNGVERNSGELGRVFNVDFRYSRFFPLADRVRLELFVESKNTFNTANVRSVNSVVTTDTLGNPVATLPSGSCEVKGSTDGCFPVTGVYQSQQFQLGAKLTF